MKQVVAWGLWVIACLIRAAPVGAVVYWTEDFEAYQLGANIGDYAEGGQFAESTLICSQAVWRSIGDGMLRSFFIITSSDSNQGTVYLDDIQLTDPAIEEDTCAAVLADPYRGALAGDISGPDGEPDCYVDIYDLVALAGQWLMSQ